MILVPSETLSRFHQPQPRSDPLEVLHNELAEVLKDPHLDDYEKWTRYQQTLQRCLRYAEERRKPLSFTIDGFDNGVRERRDVGRGAEPEQDPPIHRHNLPVFGPAVSPSSATILETIPRAYHPKALALLGNLKRSELITWTEDGRVLIDNKEIPNAHIIDLVNDALRKRKNVSIPDGWEEFYKTLARINMPQELIGNEDRRRVIRDFAVGGTPRSLTPLSTTRKPPRVTQGPLSRLEPSVLESMWSEATPRKSKTGAIPKASRRNLNWESFRFTD